MLEEELARIVAFATDCARDGQTALLDEFVRGGFPVDHPDSAGNTVLMLAAYHGHPATVAMLLAPRTSRALPTASATRPRP